MRVQGTGAASEIAVAIRELATPNVHWQRLDLIVIARGGGSIEDLWEFNEEIVARTIAAMEIPIVSAIGHEGVHSPGLRPLDYDALDAYVRVERPGGKLDTAYARCVATLEQPEYPRHLYELAVKIDSDGMQHYERFREMRRTLSTYRGAGAPWPYLRDIRLGTPEETKPALDLYGELLGQLREGYLCESCAKYGDAQQAIGAARRTMDRLNRECEALAVRGLGVPFFSLS